MTTVILTAAATVTLACLVVFFVGGLMFSRSASRALAVVALTATVAAYFADHSGPSVAVFIFCVVCTLLFTLIAWAAGEN